MPLATKGFEQRNAMNQISPPQAVADVLLTALEAVSEPRRGD
jgi:hypothetical protein